MSLLDVIMSMLYLLNSPFCHQLPERSFFIVGYKLPLCARCTGIYLGLLNGYLIGLRTVRRNMGIRPSSVVLLVLAALPAAVDGLAQYVGGIESTNLRRLITGTLFGTAAGRLLIPVLAALNGCYRLSFSSGDAPGVWWELGFLAASLAASMTIVYLGVFIGPPPYLVALSLLLTMLSWSTNLVLPVVGIASAIRYLRRS